MEKTTLELQTAKKRSQLAMIWHRLTKNKLAVIGLIIIVTMIVASIAIGFTVDYNKIILHDLKNKLQGPACHTGSAQMLTAVIFFTELYTAPAFPCLSALSPWPAR